MLRLIQNILKGCFCGGIGGTLAGTIFGLIYGVLGGYLVVILPYLIGGFSLGGIIGVIIGVLLGGVIGLIAPVTTYPHLHKIALGVGGAIALIIGIIIPYSVEAPFWLSSIVGTFAGIISGSLGGEVAFRCYVWLNEDGYS